MNCRDQVIRAISITGLLVPLSCLLLCASYAVRARLELGYWASYDNPDPKNLGWPVHHSLILLSLLSIYPALLCSTLSAVWLLHRRRILSGPVIMISAVFLWVGMTLLGQSAIGDEFAAWYMD